MMNVGVVLSGCGHMDGAEIQEAVFTLLALDERGAKAVCCAPDIEVTQVMDHLKRKPANESRNVLRESARIARGEIVDVASVRAADLGALILPGGFGAAKNLCTFAVDGASCSVNRDVEKLVGDVLEAGKPVGAICIAPALLARIAGGRGKRLRLTIGDDAATANAIAAMGCDHANCPVTEFVVDEENRVVTTPAYMLGPGPAAVFQGVRKLVYEVLRLAS